MHTAKKSNGGEGRRESDVGISRGREWSNMEPLSLQVSRLGMQVVKSVCYNKAQLKVCMCLTRRIAKMICIGGKKLRTPVLIKQTHVNKSIAY